MTALIRATTRTLPATENDGTRVKVTLSTGEQATYPHTYQLHGPEFHADCALRLARQSQLGTDDIEYKITGENAGGYAIALWPAGTAEG